jgi:hypothetical protein
LNPAQVFACNAGEVFGSAVAWSLGNTAADGSGPARPMPRLNGFSVLDAREAVPVLAERVEALPFVLSQRSIAVATKYDQGITS